MASGGERGGGFGVVKLGTRGRAAGCCVETRQKRKKRERRSVSYSPFYCRFSRRLKIFVCCSQGSSVGSYDSVRLKRFVFVASADGQKEAQPWRFLALYPLNPILPHPLLSITLTQPPQPTFYDVHSMEYYIRLDSIQLKISYLKEYLKEDMHITPLSDLKTTARQISAFGRIPNTSIQGKPLLIYHSAFDGSPDEISGHLEKVGAVKPQWTYTMYPTNHFHSTTHEVLCVVSGNAKVCFGHVDNPSRLETTVSKGDVMIVPAGVSHQMVEDLGGRFSMVGSYPAGKEWDMCYGNENETGKDENIREVGWFSKDPIYGDIGPALEV